MINKNDIERLIPDLEDVNLINSGGQKTVFKGSFKRENVVIKVIEIGTMLGEENYIYNVSFNRIKREISLLEKIDSPYLPKLSQIKCDFFEKDNVTYYYYSEEFIDGFTLDNYTSARKDAIKIALHVSEAIKYLWDNFKVVHRDIKPNNIMYNSITNKFLLIDLGIALILNETSLTKTDVIPGTIMYMSPEQLTQPKRILDFRSDLFQLGVCLYETITGFHPFVRDESINNKYEIRNDILSNKAEKIINLTSDFPIEFLEFIDRIINKHPYARFRSMDEVINLLNGLIRG